MSDRSRVLEDKGGHLDELYAIAVFLCLTPGLELIEVGEDEGVAIFAIAGTVRLL